MNLIYRFRYFLLALVLLLGALLFPHFKQALAVDNSLTAWFVEDDPALQSYYRFQEYFGNDELVLLVLEDEALISPQVHARLKDLEQALEKLPSVKQVLSPLDLETASMGFKSSSTFWSAGLNSQQLKERMEDNPGLGELFFNDHLQAVKLIIQLELSPQFEAERGAILQEIYQTTDRHWSAEQSYFGGLGVIYEALNQLSKADFQKFLGLGYLLMFVLLWLLYRRLRFVVLALLTVALASYFTFGVYGWFDLRINLLSILIPPVIILLGVMDVIHILNERFSHPGGRNTILRRVWSPCLFTSLTTMAGFASLAVSPVKILREFGLFTALGIALALFFSFFFAFFFLPNQSDTRRSFNIQNTLSSLFFWTETRAKGIFTGFLVLAILGAAGLAQLKVDTDSISYLPSDHPVKKDSDRIEALFGPYMPLEYLVYASVDQPLNQPEVLAGFARFDLAASALPAVGSVNGLHDLYLGLFQKRYGENWERGFQNKGLMRRIQSEVELRNPELIADFSQKDYTVGRLSIAGKLVSAAELNQTIAELEHLAKENLHPTVKLEISGYQSLYAGIVNYVTRSQVQSFGLALVLIFGLLFLYLRRLNLTLVAIIPNLFPVLMMLGFMGWSGIYLDTATASIASIVLSFSIDDTIHFIWRYRKLKEQGTSARLARLKTLQQVGQAIVFSSAVLFIGYFLMLFGSLKTVVLFGLLTALSIAAALLAQLFLFPSLLKYFDPE